MQTTTILTSLNNLQDAGKQNKIAPSSQPLTSFNSMLNQEIASKSPATPPTNASSSNNTYKENKAPPAQSAPTPSAPPNNVQPTNAQTKSTNKNDDDSTNDDQSAATDKDKNDVNPDISAQLIALVGNIAQTPQNAGASPVDSSGSSSQDAKKDINTVEADISKVATDLTTDSNSSTPAIDTKTLTKDDTNPSTKVATDAAFAAALAQTKSASRQVVDDKKQISSADTSKISSADSTKKTSDIASTLAATDQAKTNSDGKNIDVNEQAGKDKSPPKERVESLNAKELNVNLADSKTTASTSKNDKFSEQLVTARLSDSSLDKNVAAPTPAAAAQAFNPNVQNTINNAALEQIAPRVGTSGWDKAVGQKVVWMVGEGLQSAELTLNPPDLGPLQVVLKVSNDQANASFFAAQPEVREALESALPRLRQMMSDAGVQLTGFSVNSQAANQGQGFAQQQSQPSYGNATTSLPSVAISETVSSVATKITPKLGAVDTFA
ncbi:MAG: flagellar hook-length control protein FliK [Burkholderiales bacterium]|nr:flagellar hook-length control protein FliK [Burkholderiales bacterium]